jgi:hypothetical protein
MPNLQVLVDGVVRFDAEVDQLKLSHHTPKTIDGCSKMELTATLPPAGALDHVDGGYGNHLLRPHLMTSCPNCGSGAPTAPRDGCYDGWHGRWAHEQWTDPFAYEAISDGPPVLPILIGVVGICLAALTALLLLVHG